MGTRRRNAATLILLSSLAFSSYASLSPAFANGNNAGEFAKYLNPFQKKGYLNQSQDRVIKKKAFKADSMPVSGAAANKELGFFAIVPFDKISDAAFVEQLLSNSKVSGVSAAFPWSQIEPTEDKFNWEPIDQLITACQNHQKTLILRVTTCGIDAQGADKSRASDTPKWVFDDGVKSVTYSDASGTHTMPIFWDKNYLAKWSNFVGELADRYDSNPNIHSIGITGGGFGIGTAVVPGDASVASGEGKAADLAGVLKKEHGMSQRQIVEHWKYVADLFPKRFQNARLNFNINGPLHGRQGEDALDEIADYLVYRYGERIYLTRSGIKDGKHGFDDYRLLLKFHHDTLTGMRFADEFKPEEMQKIAKNALDDGISYAELPVTVLNSSDPAVQTALDQIAAHIGYQLVNEKVTVSDRVGSGEPLKATFTFVNAGAATAMRPERNFDKDSAMSYRLQLEVRDNTGKPVLLNLHTPPTPTSQWEPGKPVTWEQELKMADANKRQLPPGDYSVWLSVVDPGQKRKLRFLHSAGEGKFASDDTVQVGKLTITAVATNKPTSTAEAGSGDKAQ